MNNLLIVLRQRDADALSRVFDKTRLHVIAATGCLMGSQFDNIVVAVRSEDFESKTEREAFTAWINEAVKCRLKNIQTSKIIFL